MARLDDARRVSIGRGVTSQRCGHRSSWSDATGGEVSTCTVQPQDLQSRATGSVLDFGAAAFLSSVENGKGGRDRCDRQPRQNSWRKCRGVSSLSSHDRQARQAVAGVSSGYLGPPWVVGLLVCRVASWHTAHTFRCGCRYIVHNSGQRRVRQRNPKHARTTLPTETLAIPPISASPLLSNFFRP